MRHFWLTKHFSHEKLQQLEHLSPSATEIKSLHPMQILLIKWANIFNEVLSKDCWQPGHFRFFID
jgi:hypothetical protein